MPVSYLHGLETIELNDGARPVRTVKSSTIGIIGTAPNANVDKFPLNKPVAIFADNMLAADLGSEGTLRDAVDAIFDQGSSVVVVVRIEEGGTEHATFSNAVGSSSLRTGLWSLLNARSTLRLVPKLLAAPGLTSKRPTNGVASVSIGTPGTGYTQATTTVAFAAAPTGGRTATGVVTVVDGAVTAITITDPGYGYTEAPAITITDSGATPGTNAAATATLGGVANPVAVALAALSPRLRAVSFLDGPGTTYDAAIAYRNDFGSDRVMVIDPAVLRWNATTSQYVNKPASAYACGIQARVDVERGFWHSLSNEQILNIGGSSRPVDWMPNDRASEANNLNENEITTIIHDDGFRFWGVRSTSTDPLWAHLSVRRTADMVYESLERAHRSYLDNPFSYPLLEAIQSSVQDYLTLLRARGALIGGQCWIEPSVNTPATFSAGQLTVDFDLEPPALLEHLQFRARRNPTYYEGFIEEFSRRITG